MVRKAFQQALCFVVFAPLVLTLGSLLAAPDASAQCSAKVIPPDSNVRFSSCTTLTLQCVDTPVDDWPDSVTAPAGTKIR